MMGNSKTLSIFFSLIAVELLQCSNCFLLPHFSRKKLRRPALQVAEEFEFSSSTTSSSRSSVSSVPKLKSTRFIDYMAENVVKVEPTITTNVGTMFQGLVPIKIGLGCDIVVQWNDPYEGAKELVDAIKEKDQLSFLPGKNNDDDLLLSFLYNDLQMFQTMALMDKPGIGGWKDIRLKTRIVSSRGPIGTKCPRWHYDYTPIRWVQSLVGPGCDYVVSEKGVNRAILNRSDDDDTERTNDEIVDAAVADIRQEREGTAIILRGLEGNTKLPAIHKSPELQWWQGRVLMTIDVMHD